MNPLVHRNFLLLRPLHFQHLYQRLDRDSLQEDSKVNDADCTRDEHPLERHSIVDQEGQGKGHSATQSSVGDHKLIDSRQLVEPETICHFNENGHADEPIEDTEEDRQQYKGDVKVVIVIDCGHAQEHEDDRFRRAGQHLQRILDRCVTLLADVRLDVILHRDPAKGDTENR